MESNAPLLSFGDVVLRSSDVALLQQPEEWVNDQIISFYFEYLASSEVSPAGHDVAYLDASSSYLLSNSAPDDAEIIFEALQLHSKGVILFPVNNNKDVSRTAGGSHWCAARCQRAW